MRPGFIFLSHIFSHIICSQQDYMLIFQYHKSFTCTLRFIYHILNKYNSGLVHRMELIYENNEKNNFNNACAYNIYYGLLHIALVLGVGIRNTVC